MEYSRIIKCNASISLAYGEVDYKAIKRYGDVSFELIKLNSDEIKITVNCQGRYVLSGHLKEVADMLEVSCRKHCK